VQGLGLEAGRGLRKWFDGMGRFRNGRINNPYWKID